MPKTERGCYQEYGKELICPTVAVPKDMNDVIKGNMTLPDDDE